MGVLSNLEPKKVFYYFEEITKIPHGSGNVEQISDFLVDFAKAHKAFLYTGCYEKCHYGQGGNSRIRE